MRIRPGLHLVLSGSAGFDLSHPSDCNAYLLDTGDGFALFDAGAGIAPAATVLAAIAAEGVEPARVRWLFLTHGHADHAGGAAALHEALGIAVIAGAATATILRAGDAAAISLDRAVDAGIFPPDYVFRACPVAAELQPGAALTLGGVRVEAIASPGHSHDHCCYRVATDGGAALVSGDALFAGGRVILQDTYDCSVTDTCATLRRLERIAFETFLPGHGAFSLARGKRHVAAAMERVLRLLPPEQFF